MSSNTMTNTDYLSENQSFHACAYAGGYGIQYPEGHIIRCYNRVLRNELGMDGRSCEKLLDFGCGNGIHCAFFREKGFNVHGLDSDKIAIQQCKDRFPDIAGHFAVVDPRPDAGQTFFDGGFDVVVSNQVLYYLSTRDLTECVHGLFHQMKPGGVFIASMMGESTGFFERSQPGHDGLRRVEIGEGTDLHVSYINFTASKVELCTRFEPFEPLHVGYYDFSIGEHEGSSLHYLFIGRKG